MDIAISVGSTNGAKRQSSCGVAFTIDPDTGFQKQSS
jgi:hypothetical protein